jgi:rhodanese-related sulfurtransferase
VRDPACPLCGDAPTIHKLDPVGPAPAPSTIPEIDAAELDAMLASGARVLDVRDPHERVLGEIPNSVAIPSGELERRLHELDTAQTYVVACRVGQKSRWAAERMREAGFGRLYHLRDGLLAYAVLDADFGFF